MTGHRGLVTIGETMALLTTPAVGRLRHAPSLTLSVGGAESNVAIGVRRLGCPAAWIGRVGADELGELVVSRLRAEGVDVSGVVTDPGVPTSLMVKERRTADITRVTYYRAGGPGTRLHPDDLRWDRIVGAGVLHLTGITPALGPSPRATVEAAMSLARSSGVPVSFDVNYRAALWSRDQAGPVLRELASACDILFAGDDEAGLLGVAGQPADLARGLCALGPRQAVVKLGARGAVACVDGEVHEVAPVPVNAVDAVGAGDAFVAGYLAELLRGAPVKERLATAAACGAFAVTAPGDWEGQPTRAELGLLTMSTGTVVR
ncbi:sugar kinase [Thermoactinospora rubra]|uniref:sugar kinase n=1 Tax=Thermoactinospora rubra TaxID=1088767 RepID=UPI000A11C655|nr:sugar kinase [Thermoactinospora rubra]